MNELTIYNYKTLITDSQHEFVTIKGVSLEDILNEYSTEDIVGALFNTDKAGDVLDLIIKTNENGREE